MGNSFNVSKTISLKPTLSDKALSAARLFGLTIDRLTGRSVTHKCSFEVDDGDIVYITGPSGAGKSVLLGELEKSVPPAESINLSRIELPSDRTLIDCIDGDYLKCLRILSVAGLGDCFCVLNQPSNLSAGEKYRFRLAMALASDKKFVFADEFCSELGRISAAVVSLRLHDYAKRSGTIFILASSHEDIMLDLSPDVMVVKDLTGNTEVVYRKCRWD